MSSNIEFLERTFQLCPGVGPWRERDLWARGIETWSDFQLAASKSTVMSTRLDAQLIESIESARLFLQTRDLASLVALLAPNVHWRLYRPFETDTVFLDLEADVDRNPTILGLLDANGLASFRQDLNLHRAEERLKASPLWVTFNGGAYDLPIVSALYPHLPPPTAHVDVRVLLGQLKFVGGLKAIEARAGVVRPDHVKSVNGAGAISLWRHFQATGNVADLRLLTEYNLHDVVNLKVLLEWAQWKLAEKYCWHVAPPVRPFERGDVLYDLTLLLDAL
jgi:uncharacterized protein